MARPVKCHCPRVWVSCEGRNSGRRYKLPAATGGSSSPFLMPHSRLHLRAKTNNVNCSSRVFFWAHVKLVRILQTPLLYLDAMPSLTKGGATIYKSKKAYGFYCSPQSNVQTWRQKLIFVMSLDKGEVSCLQC